MYQLKAYQEKRAGLKRAVYLETLTEQNEEVSDVHSRSASESSGAKPASGDSENGDVNVEAGASAGVGVSVLEKMDIEFQDLGLTLHNGKTILANVSGVLRAGRVAAIMGPSGAGKTTFLSVLSGKVKKSKGVITVNGKEENNGITRFRSLVGYVPQEDVMIRTSTVYSILRFSANYRLPRNESKEQRKQKVFDAIQLLGLSNVMESVIGDEKTRGISGGQRKRVNIGIELVTDPKVLFLDEPTSGLDSSSSLDVCMALRRLARTKNVLVAAVLHQPRYEIFAAFDDLLILGKGGRTIYIGAGEDALPYFESLGFHCPPRVNAADFLMDIASGKVCRERESIPFDSCLLPSLWEMHQSNKNQLESNPKTAKDFNGVENVVVEIPGTLQSASAAVTSDRPSSTPRKRMSAEKSWLRRRCDSLREFVRDAKSDVSDYASDLRDSLKTMFTKDEFRQTPSAFVLLWLCFKRSMSCAYPGWGRFLRENLLHIMIGLFLGVVARPNKYLGPLPQSMSIDLCPFMLQQLCTLPLSDGYELLALFLCWGLSFAGAATAVSTFGFEEANYFREVGSGMKTLPYYIAKALSDIPRVGLAAFFFELAYLGVYDTSANIFVLYSIALLLYANGIAIGYVLTTVIGVGLTPLFSVVVTLLFSAVLSGGTNRLPTVDSEWMWMFSLSYARWGMNAYYVLEVENYDFYDVERGYELYGYHSTDIPRCLGYMTLIALGWHVIAYLVMVMTNRSKKK
eukprot:ANDGO_07546.mRNA.1 ABC transporter G family member 24